LPAGFSRNIQQADITFSLDNQLIGVAETSRSGKAFLERIFPEAGTFIIRLSYPGNEKFSPVESYLRVFICNPATTFLVTEIDGVLARTNSQLNLYSGRYNPQPSLRAPIVLRRLVSRNDIVVIYLTSREKILSNLTRDWLLERGFPPGPVFSWDSDDDPFSPLQGKIAHLERLKNKWSGLKYGIDAEREIIEVMAGMGLQTFWLTPEAVPTAPPEVEVVPDWRLIETALIPESTFEK
jgi:hypothetical protein